jgi:hypothetical protein
MAWLDTHMVRGKQLVAATEGILWKEERNWGWGAFKTLYGEGIRSQSANRPVYNAGFIAGTAEAMMDLVSRKGVLYHTRVCCIIQGWVLMIACKGVR